MITDPTCVVYHGQTCKLTAEYRALKKHYTELATGMSFPVLVEQRHKSAKRNADHCGACGYSVHVIYRPSGASHGRTADPMKNSSRELDYSELELRVVVHTKSLEKGFKVAL